MNQEAARKLAEKVIGTGNKGYLIVVFPEGDPPWLKMKDVSFATNANNHTVLAAISLITEMICTGSYKQEILGQGQPQLPGRNLEEF